MSGGLRSPLWALEDVTRRRGFGRIAGIDEAGRGPLAGPVVSAAVILPEDFEAGGITDSKKLSPARRSAFYQTIYEGAVSIGIGIIDPVEIDRINILRAALLSMAISVENLSPGPDFLLIDGPFRIASPFPQNPVKHGDALSVSIAAASIVAKVTRDRLMDRYHEEFPEYGFSRHKGYGTREHLTALRRYGCCPIHRRFFRGVCGAGE